MQVAPNVWSNYFNIPNPGLRAYFSNVVSGQPEVYRTPFYKGMSLESICDEWNRKLVSIDTQWPTLMEFEDDLRKKVGPMSVMLPLKERMSDIDSYYDSISKDQVPFDVKAISAAKSEWKGVSRLRLRSEVNTVAVMKKSTNSGSPYFSKRRAVVSKTVPCDVYMDGRDCIMRQNGHEWSGAAVLGWRGQEGGPKPKDVKQRVVWMFPFAVNIRELQVYQPLILTFQRLGLVPAWVSMEAVDRRITKMFDTKGPRDVVVCTDFSKFDQHFNPTCQSVAKELLADLFTGQEAVDWLERVFPIKYAIPLAYNWGEIRYGIHGMGSGSGGTNADETLVHRVLQHEAAISHHTTLNPNSQCLGDDGVLTYPGISAEDVMQSYSRHGLDMNLEKQYVSKQDCTYLRRWHHTDYRVDGICVGVYSTMRALGRLAMQERYYDPDVWGEKMVTLRYLSIIENVKYHPLKEEFLDFCIKGDKTRLGLGIPGFLDNIASEAQKAIDMMPDFLGYTKSLQYDGDLRRNAAAGIENWWVIQALKSRR